MCGVAGIVGIQNPENREALRRMNRSMGHRGPDGEGFWEAETDEAGWGPMLAHRRLSILDLSEAAAQPMVHPVSGDALILNGEIYNYAELRERIEYAGSPLTSTGDTAVTLHVLSSKGASALDELRGMFALAHWNRASRELTIARDPLGIKPLYVVRNRSEHGTWSLAFASEVRALLASRLIDAPRLNASAVQSVVWNGFVVSPYTIIEGVECSPPGEAITLDGRGRELRRWRFWNRRRATAAPASTEAGVQSALEESVRLHLASDVPLGVFLSGGVDSSVVANLAHRATGRVRTFTLAFDDERFNEGGYARAVADAIGTEHQEVLLTQQRFLGRLESAIDSLDQPTFDGINSYVMSMAVRDAGFKVALVGTGGDELFGGYTSFRDLPRLQQWAGRVGWIPLELRLAAARAFAAFRIPTGGVVPAQTRWAKLPDMVRNGDDLIALYQLAYGLFLPDFHHSLLGSSGAAGTQRDGLPTAMRQLLIEEVAGRTPLAALSVLEQRLFLGERLLRDTDAASMAASIEVRLPLVDVALVDAVEGLPDTERFMPVRSKAMLRRIGLGGLNPELFERPKKGFELPYERWLKGALGDQVAATLCDRERVSRVGLAPDAVARLWNGFRSGSPGLYWTRVWAIYVLISWSSKHGLSL